MSVNWDLVSNASVLTFYFQNSLLIYTTVGVVQRIAPHRRAICPLALIFPLNILYSGDLNLSIACKKQLCFARLIVCFQFFVNKNYMLEGSFSCRLFVPFEMQGGYNMLHLRCAVGQYAVCRCNGSCSFTCNHCSYRVAVSAERLKFNSLSDGRCFCY